MIPSYWKQATQELATNDNVMRQLTQRFEDVALDSRGNAFTTLARSIVGQQISVKAAEKVWQKVVAAVPETTPDIILNIDESMLRACGLSFRKIGYLQDLSQHFTNGNLNEVSWNEMNDESVIAQLTRVKGIGRWSAEMFLIFHMLRPDILPMDDIGLQRAIRIHYNANQPIDKSAMHTIAATWQPWRSVATWHLWRSLDPVPVEY
jgi:DNA-3-methyladenine glycosylase II